MCVCVCEWMQSVYFTLKSSENWEKIQWILMWSCVYLCSVVVIVDVVHVIAIIRLRWTDTIIITSSFMTVLQLSQLSDSKIVDIFHILNAYAMKVDESTDYGGRNSERENERTAYTHTLNKSVQFLSTQLNRVEYFVSVCWWQMIKSSVNWSRTTCMYYSDK